MAFNHIFNHGYAQGNYTFHGNTPAYVPPPPSPPPYFIPPTHAWTSEFMDANTIKSFECRIPNIPLVKPKASISISKVREQIHNMLLILQQLALKECILTDKMSELSDEEWSNMLKDIEDVKNIINKMFANFNNLNFDHLSNKIIKKRLAKRARQKRQREQQRKAKESWKNSLKENSRRIDESLQKIYNKVIQAKQAEVSKLQADAILRETLHKKQDAKKNLVIIDALNKLRKARLNTAKGRGENVSEQEADVFVANIEKLKSLWMQRLDIYEKEEVALCDKLCQDADGSTQKAREAKQIIANNLEQWKVVMFGGAFPQVDFEGEVGRFLNVRSQWDQFLKNDGVPLPIGWLPPKTSLNI